MTPDIYEHVLYQLFNTPIRKYPFDHLNVENVFPEEFYKELLTHLPETNKYIPLEKLGMVQSGYYKERGVFPILPELMKYLPEEKKCFWAKFYEAFGGHAFQQALFNHFSVSSESELQSTLEITRDTTRYAIGPHTDIPSKILSLIFYFPKENDKTGLGTSLFVPRDPNFRDPEGAHHSFDDFKLVKTMPFQSNSVFGFVRTDTSFHGVIPIVEEQIERYTLQFQIKTI